MNRAMKTATFDTCDLERIPGVGPSISRDLQDLGIANVADLRGKNPQRLFDELNSLRGEKQDRCVLYVFRCATYFAANKNYDPELLKWWNWKDRKAGSER
ncbi:MAG: DUF4332 domain-containing protein [Chromatiales bacterium]|jgi:hypothetical protein